MDRYEKGKQLRLGGQATVHAVVDRRCPTAKIILKAPLTRHAACELRREARLLASLQHLGHVVRLYDSVEIGDEVHLVLGRLDLDVFDACLNGAFEDDSTLLMVTLQLFKAVAELHALGVVHRDLKPENLMLTWQGHLSLIDFGYAHTVKDEEQPGWYDLRGTSTYCSPELWQAQTMRMRLKPTDMWSCGIILYGMLTQRVPFVKAQDNVLLFDDFRTQREKDPLYNVFERLDAQCRDGVMMRQDGVYARLVNRCLDLCADTRLRAQEAVDELSGVL